MKKIVKVIVGALVGLSMIVPQGVLAKEKEKEDPEMNKVSYWETHFGAEDGYKWEFGDGVKTFKISDYQTEEEISKRIYLGVVLKAGSINSNDSSAHEAHGDPSVSEVFPFSNGKDLSHVILVWRDKPPVVDPGDNGEDDNDEDDEVIDEVDEEEPDDNDDDEDQTDPVEEEEEEPVDEEEEDPVDEEVPVDEEEPADEEEPVKEEPIEEEPVKEEPVYVEPTDESLPKTGSVDSSTLTLFGGLISSLGILFLLPKRKK